MNFNSMKKYTLGFIALFLLLGIQQCSAAYWGTYVDNNPDHTIPGQPNMNGWLVFTDEQPYDNCVETSPSTHMVPVPFTALNVVAGSSGYGGVKIPAFFACPNPQVASISSPAIINSIAPIKNEPAASSKATTNEPTPTTQKEINDINAKLFIDTSKIEQLQQNEIVNLSKEVNVDALALILYGAVEVFLGLAIIFILKRNRKNANR